MDLVLTLVDKDYYPGLAALINSLVAHGFSGGIVVGATNPFPEWLVASLTPQQAPDSYRLGELQIERVPMQATRHVVHCKPAWIAEMTARFHQYDRVFFIDADITIQTEWNYFQRWADAGVALCSDVNYLMPATDPIRLQWAQLLEKAGRPVRSQLDWYVNSGFLGVTRQTAAFASLWTDIYSENAHLFPDTTKMRTHGREHIFMSANQDTLNLATMASELPISIMGPSSMGFMSGFIPMHHPLGPVKPWRKPFIRDALAGWAPRDSEKAYWRYAEGPVRTFPAAHIRSKRLALDIATVISRFFRRW